MKDKAIKRLWVPLALILLIGIAVYSNIYHYPFVFDDQSGIVEKEEIRHLANYLSLEQLLKPRRIALLTFALNYKIGKLNVFGYHLVNIVIHIINGYLIYFLALTIFGHLALFPLGRSNHISCPKSKVQGCQPVVSQSSNSSIPQFLNSSITWMSLFAALIFVVHPIQTQAVTYTVQRIASMAAMFYMASVFFYLKARIIQQGAESKGQGADVGGQMSEGRGQRVERSKLKAQSSRNQPPSAFSFQLSAYFALSVICGMLAYLSKQNTASLPGVIILVEYLIIDHSWVGWKRKIPWFILGFMFWIVFVSYISGFFSGGAEGKGLLEDVSGFMRETDTVSRWSYLCTQFNVVVIYMRLLFLPIGQNVDYMYGFKEGFFDGYTPLAFLFLIGVVFVGIWNIKRRPIIAFSIFWFFITLSVESSVIPIRDAMFEHRLYLPMFGFAVFVSYMVFNLLSKSQSWAIVAGICIVLSFGIATYLRNVTWKDEVTLWTDVVSKSPESFRAHNNLGIALEKQGRASEGVKHLFEALRVKPNNARAHFNLGQVFMKQNRLGDALSHYLEAVRMRPDYGEAHYGLGLAFADQGKLDRAVGHYSKAIRLQPENADIHNSLGLALMSKGKPDEAIRQFSQAIKGKPNYAEAHNNMGHAMMVQGRVGDAIFHFSESVRIDPQVAEAWNNLGGALARRGRLDDAVRHFSEAVRIKPGDPKMRYNLGLVLMRFGRIDEAVEHFSEALRIKPDYVKARQSLERCLRMIHKSTGEQVLQNNPF